MKRVFTLINRGFSKLPKVVEEYKQKEPEALQEIHNEKEEESKKEWDLWFPDPNKIVTKRELPSYVSNYGKSDEEDTPAFFLEDLSAFQYIYTPKHPLEFDSDGFAPVFQATPKYFFMPNKLQYCWKIVLPVLFSLGISLQPMVHSTLSIVFSWCIPAIIMSRALMVDKIMINQDGRTAKFVYKRFKFMPLREKLVDVSTFKEPTGDAFIIWSVYEFPDDLKTFNENPAVARIAFGKYINWWSFFLMPKFPTQINREVLVNLLNGIYIDTKQTGGEDLQSRYYILEPKVK